MPLLKTLLWLPTSLREKDKILTITYEIPESNYPASHLVLLTQLYFFFFSIRLSSSSMLCNSVMQNAIQSSKQATSIDKILIHIPSKNAFGKDQFTYHY